MANASHLREKILTFIKDFRERKGYAPTVREIAQGCGVTTPSVVQYHLNQLERAGLISREKEKFRSISLTGHRGLPVQVPVLGTIAAGHPIWVPSADMWSATAARLIEVPSEITQGRKDLYALEVRGNSMVDAMIADGDIVIMEPVSSIKNGDVAACWLKNEQVTAVVTEKTIINENINWVVLLSSELFFSTEAIVAAPVSAISATEFKQSEALRDCRLAGAVILV